MKSVANIPKLKETLSTEEYLVQLCIVTSSVKKFDKNNNAVLKCINRKTVQIKTDYFIQSPCATLGKKTLCSFYFKTIVSQK